MITLDTFKRGDTFAFISKMTDLAGLPVTGVAANLKAEVRTNAGVKLSDCVITETDTLGSYLFKVSDTTKWPVTTIFTDIQYTGNGVVTSSNTIAIPVEKDITL